MTAAPPNAALPFNKMFVMLPVMLAARQLDGEDAHIVYLVRVAYAAMQTLCVVAVVWTFFRARSVRDSTTIVYVPAAPQVSMCLCVFVVLLSFCATCFAGMVIVPLTLWSLWYTILASYTCLHHDAISHSPIPMPRKSTRKLRMDSKFTRQRVLC